MGNNWIKEREILQVGIGMIGLSNLIELNLKLEGLDMREYNINSIVTSFSNLRILEDLKLSLKSNEIKIMGVFELFKYIPRLKKIKRLDVNLRSNSINRNNLKEEEIY